LTEVTNTVLAASELDAAASGVTLERSLTPAAVTGDQRLIERLVSNLIQNAIRHNFRGGRVDVSVRAEGLTATLQVTNTGPIVPAEEIHRLMQPFQRLARPRTGQGAGLGLGLSIVAAVADAHGARLKIRREVAGGLNVVVQFPLQLVLEDLSEGVAGEGVHELHLAGALERSKALGGKLE
jgi:signal transduction histidine kinase